MAVDQIKAFMDTGQYAQGQQVDLQDTQGIQVVFVPFDHRTIRHGRIGDWHDLRQAAPGDDETAHMLG